MTVNLYQFIISIPLFLVLAFGLGFILNMIVKTTWVPVILYIIVVVALLFYVGSVTGFDAAILFAGLVGAILSGVVMRFLRAKGYRMF